MSLGASAGPIGPAESRGVLDPGPSPQRRTGRGIRPSREELLIAGVSGLLFALAFPPLPLAPLAFVCLIPLAARIAHVADAGESASVAARLGAWFAIIGFGVALNWIAVALSLFTSLAFLAYAATIVGMAALVAATTATLYLARRLTRLPMALLLPATWVALEMALAYLSDLAFPWFPLGLAVATHPTLAQAADVSGVHGLSIWVAATNGLLADAWLVRRASGTSKHSGFRRAAPRVVAALVLGVAVWAYGVWRIHTVVLRPLARIGIVQPNIPEDEKLQLAMRNRFIEPLAALTRQQEAHARADLIVWPETALPDFLINHPAWTDSLKVIEQTGHTPILFGMIDYTITGPGPSDYEYFNAATLIDSTGRIGGQPAYHKRYLVPIVERVPFLDPHWFTGHTRFDALLKYFGGFGRGTSAVPFTLPFGRVGVLICYESIFPQQARRYRRAGADLIVNMTNDAWFGRGLAPYQHEAHMRLRAIENRVGIVRAANTGISEYLDPLGRPHGATSLFVAAAPVFDAQTTSLMPLAVQWGDWLGVACVVGTLAVLLAGLIGRLRAPRSGA